MANALHDVFGDSIYVLSDVIQPATQRQHSRRGRDGGPTHFLLYLNDQTFVDAPGQLLAHEVRSARESGSPSVVMVHENDPHRGGCIFDTFFATTPGDLLQGGIYKAIALALHSGGFWPVSVALVARALGATDANGCTRGGTITATAVRPAPRLAERGMESMESFGTSLRGPSSSRIGASSSEESFGSGVGGTGEGSGAGATCSCGDKIRGSSVSRDDGEEDEQTRRRRHRASIAATERGLGSCREHSVEGPGRKTYRKKGTVKEQPTSAAAVGTPEASPLPRPVVNVARSLQHAKKAAHELVARSKSRRGTSQESSTAGVASQQPLHQAAASGQVGASRAPATLRDPPTPEHGETTVSV